MGRPRIKKIETAIDLEKLETSPSMEEQEGVEEEPKKEVVKIVKAKIRKIRSKRYQSLVKEIDKSRDYPLNEAIEVLKKTSKLNFDPTVEVHVNLNLDISKTDQQVRGTANLAHGTGKKIKILVFALQTKNQLEEPDVKVAGNDFISEIEKTGKIDFDRVIATPEMMPALSKIAKVLGPKGLMPNPKAGTITSNPEKTIQEIRTGLIEFRSLSGSPLIHSIIGKASFDTAKLESNFQSLYAAILQSKPSGAKGELINSIYLSTTMGPSVKLDLKSLQI